jgi:hypothetical protein
MCHPERMLAKIAIVSQLAGGHFVLIIPVDLVGHLIRRVVVNDYELGIF